MKKLIISFTPSIIATLILILSLTVFTGTQVKAEDRNYLEELEKDKYNNAVRKLSNVASFKDVQLVKDYKVDTRGMTEEEKTKIEQYRKMLILSIKNDNKNKVTIEDKKEPDKTKPITDSKSKDEYKKGTYVLKYSKSKIKDKNSTLVESMVGLSLTLIFIVDTLIRFKSIRYWEFRSNTFFNIVIGIVYTLVVLEGILKTLTMLNITSFEGSIYIIKTDGSFVLGFSAILGILFYIVLLELVSRILLINKYGIEDSED